MRVQIPAYTDRSYGYAGRFFRDVVLNYEGDDCLLWPFGKDTHGYGNVWHEGRRRVVSHLVCEWQRGPRPSPQHEGMHSCGNGHIGCVTPRHMDWGARSQNQTGVHARGEDQVGAKLTTAQVAEIRSLDRVIPRRVIAQRFGVGKTTVTNIINRKKWNVS